MRRHGRSQPILVVDAQNIAVPAHAHASGTPTLGGLPLVGGALAGYLISHLRKGVVFSDQTLVVWAGVLAMGAVGLIDDLIKDPTIVNPYDLAVFAAAFAGACGGFLWWNAAPAQIFMGDVGALAIGSALALLALTTNTHLLLPLICAINVVEIGSVALQMSAFRLSGRRRRLFRLSPIHHHFEMAGRPETRAVHPLLAAGRDVGRRRAGRLHRRLHPPGRAALSRASAPSRRGLGQMYTVHEVRRHGASTA